MEALISIVYLVWIFGTGVSALVDPPASVSTTPAVELFYEDGENYVD